MTSNGSTREEALSFIQRYGLHEFDTRPFADSYCSYGCGCYLGRSNSECPPGLDIDGPCPLNRLDGQEPESDPNFATFHTERADYYEGLYAAAKSRLDAVDPGTEELAEQNWKLQQKVTSVINGLEGILTRLKPQE